MIEAKIRCCEGKQAMASSGNGNLEYIKFLFEKFNSGELFSIQNLLKSGANVGIF